MFIWCFWTLVGSSLIKRSVFFFCTARSVHQFNPSNVNVTTRRKKKWSDNMLRIRPKIPFKMTNKNLIFTMNMEVLMAVLPFNEMIYRDWDESVMKKRKLNYIQWRVIEFGTLEKVHLWYWWLNLSFHFLFLSLSLSLFCFISTLKRSSVLHMSALHFANQNSTITRCCRYKNCLQMNWILYFLKNPFLLRSRLN